MPLPERDPFLDTLRGFALLGILWANLLFFQALNVLDPTPEPTALADPWDRAGYALTLALATGKFYPLFAFLFGAGLALMARRLAARGLSPGPPLRRRLLLLGLIGLLHGLFLWPGDVLLPYALAGGVGLLFLGRSPGTLLRWGVGFLLLAGLLVSLPPGEEGVREVRALAQGFQEAHAAGFAPWPLRLGEWTLALLGNLLAFPMVLGLLLLGMAAVGAGLPGALPRWQGILRPLASFLLPLALLVHGLLAWRTAEALAAGRLGEAYFGQGLLLAAGPFLSLGYAALLALLWLRLPPLQQALRPVAQAGRMSLSLYLLQSLLGTGLFYGFGLGLHREVGYALIPVLALGLWGLQVALAHLWLLRFPQGPLEWLWRRLAYGG